MSVKAEPFDETEFFSAIQHSGVRALLIGRRAIVLLGIPVLTADYDYWIDIDEAAKFNAAVKALDLFPNRSPEDARKFGRYLLENGDRVDVLVAKQVTGKDGEVLRFEEAWQRRQSIPFAQGVSIAIPCIDDLIRTKLGDEKQGHRRHSRARSDQEATIMTSAWDEELEPEEFERRVKAALAEEDVIAELVSLSQWFTRRYPTGKDRLAYARTKYRQWSRRPLEG